MNTGKAHRIAIIGVGAIANMHARAIADLASTSGGGRAKLVAGSCRGEEKGRKFAGQFGCKWYASYEEMLDKEKPDVATICTPSGAHLEPTLACAARGVHVLCEKPLEITTARVDQMIAAAKKAGIQLGGIFPQRYNPVVQTIQQAAAAGRFGSLATINTYVPWWRDDAYYAPQRWQGKLALDGGGALMNQSIHGVDAIQWIAGSAEEWRMADGGWRMERQGPTATASSSPSTICHPPSTMSSIEEVFAFTAKRSHDTNLIEVEDTAVVALRYRNGALGQILGATSMFPGSLKRLQVSGRDGTAEVLEDELITFKFRNELATDGATREKFAAKTKSGGGASDPMAIDYSAHTRNIAAFLDALDAGKIPAIDGVEARKAVAIIEAIYESAKTGKAVEVS